MFAKPECIAKCTTSQTFRVSRSILQLKITHHFLFVVLTGVRLSHLNGSILTFRQSIFFLPKNHQEHDFARSCPITFIKWEKITRMSE